MGADLIERLAGGSDLTGEEAGLLMREMMSGEMSPVRAAAALTGLRMKGERAAEVAGFARVMREHSVRILPRCDGLNPAFPKWSERTSSALDVVGRV